MCPAMLDRAVEPCPLLLLVGTRQWGIHPIDFPLLAQSIHDEIFPVQAFGFESFEDQVKLPQEVPPVGFGFESARDMHNADVHEV